ncbi:MAG: hypothetical protein J6J42_04035 [Lachnospiraceae bacterium]|nr:hypothetical protein [Lachnospiraceae bacterium]
MYEAYLHNSDFIRTNLIVCEDEQGNLEGYHQMINGRNMAYRVAQLFYMRNQTEMRTYPVTEKVIKKLQLAPEELKELALGNLKRFSLQQKSVIKEEWSKGRRVYGRSR